MTYCVLFLGTFLHDSCVYTDCILKPTFKMQIKQYCQHVFSLRVFSKYGVIFAALPVFLQLVSVLYFCAIHLVKERKKSIMANVWIKYAIESIDSAVISDG